MFLTLGLHSWRGPNACRLWENGTGRHSNVEDESQDIRCVRAREPVRYTSNHGSLKEKLQVRDRGTSRFEMQLDGCEILCAQDFQEDRLSVVDPSQPDPTWSQTESLAGGGSEVAGDVKGTARLQAVIGRSGLPLDIEIHVRRVDVRIPRPRSRRPF